MTANDSPDDGDEYRSTDWLATCKLSYGYGHVEDQAIQAALRYAGPFEDDEDDTVKVAVWNLYADSWQTHDISGPERGAELVEHKVYELDREQATRAANDAHEASRSLDRALRDGEMLEQVDGDA